MLAPFIHSEKHNRLCRFEEPVLLKAFPLFLQIHLIFIPIMFRKFTWAGFIAALFLVLPIHETKAQKKSTINVVLPSEGTFEIIDNGTVKNTKAHIRALNYARLDKFRYENTRRTLQFKDGVTFRLHTMREVYPDNPNKVGMQPQPNHGDPKFVLGPNNSLGVTFPKHEKDKTFPRN